MHWLRSIVLVGSVLALAEACECGSSSEPSRPVPAPSRGDERAADHGEATVLDHETDVAGVSDFELVAPELAAHAERARSWAGSGTLIGTPDAFARRSVGNWLCRLETHFGVPPEVSESGFRYVFRERTSGYIVTAFADAGGPAIGGVLHDDERPIDLEQLSAIADRFARLMDATTPALCALAIGARTVGVEAGEWFERPTAPAE